MTTDHFPEKITQHVKNIIKTSNSTAVARQFLLSHIEYSLEQSPIFKKDPVNDMEFLIGNGMIRKYKNRILLITTGSCSVNCRYCFRRNFNYDFSINKDNLPELITKIKSFPEVDEIILSGGDPLTLSNDVLKNLLVSLNHCDNIARIRIHSRMLTVAPNRFTFELLDILGYSKKKIILVNHINHCDEITKKTSLIAKQLKQQDIFLLNQSVILKGVNDSAKVLTQLSNALFEIGILPYYLNILDKDIGAEHFYLSNKEVMAIYREFSKQVSGYLLPKLVYDDGLGESKKIVGTINYPELSCPP